MVLRKWAWLCLFQQIKYLRRQATDTGTNMMIVSFNFIENNKIEKMHLRGRWKYNACAIQSNQMKRNPSPAAWMLAKISISRHSCNVQSSRQILCHCIVQTVVEHKRKPVYVSFEAAPAACARRFVTPELTAFYSYLFIYISINLFFKVILFGRWVGCARCHRFDK